MAKDSTGGKNRTHVDGFGDRCITTIRRPRVRGDSPIIAKTARRQKVLLLALVVNVVLTAKTTVLGERKLFFDLFLVALGVVGNTTTFATFQFGHGVFDVSHTVPVSIRY